MPNSPSPADVYCVAIPRAQFVSFLLLIVSVLLINHVMLQVFYYQWDAGHWLLRDMFDVDEEENLPTYYSSFALLFSSGLLYAITARKTADKDPFRHFWRVLSFVFLLLSIDEVAGLHETLNTVTDFPWTIPAAIALGIGALLSLRFLLSLPPATRIQFVVAGFVFVGGAVGVEHATDWYLEDHSMNSLGYNLLTACEEGLEMLGVVLFINALLGYMGPNTIEVAPAG